jgi:hypothetical protein
LSENLRERNDLGDLGVDGRKYNKIGKVYYFGVN